MIAVVRTDVSDVRRSRLLHRGVGGRSRITADGHRESQRGESDQNLHLGPHRVSIH
jgi:hypothetical protein